MNSRGYAGNSPIGNHSAVSRWPARVTKPIGLWDAKLAVGHFAGTTVCRPWTTPSTSWINAWPLSPGRCPHAVPWNNPWVFDYDELWHHTLPLLDVLKSRYGHLPLTDLGGTYGWSVRNEDAGDYDHTERGTASASTWSSFQCGDPRSALPASRVPESQAAKPAPSTFVIRKNFARTGPGTTPSTGSADRSSSSARRGTQFWLPAPGPCECARGLRGSCRARKNL